MNDAGLFFAGLKVNFRMDTVDMVKVFSPDYWSSGIDDRDPDLRKILKERKSGYEF
ncbi:MAG: hypothetical protein ACYC9S_05080 [Leptospirales bacterium]